MKLVNLGRYGLVAGLVCWALCAMATFPALAQDMRVEVVELYTRSAEELIPVLEPMLARGGSVSGVGNKLVIRTTPANLADLRQMLATLDAPPRMLRISVRQGVTGREDGIDAEIAGSVGGEQARITVPGKRASGEPGATVSGTHGSSHVRARINASESENASVGVQTVQAIEGRPAFITLGSSIPIRSSTRVVGADGVTVTDSVTYRDVGSGFYALARTNGAMVTIQLATTADTVSDPRTGASRIQRVSSVVSGPLGKWLELGGIVENSDVGQGGLLSHSGRTAAEKRSTYIRVERVR